MHSHIVRFAGLAAAGALVVAGCDAGATARPRTASSHAQRPDASPSGRRPFTVAFGGDVHFQDQLRARLAHPSTALGPMASRLRGADLAMVNLETAVTTRGTPVPGKRYTFRAPKTAFGALRASGVDVATMANNHAVDYGPTGLRDSLAAIRSSRFPTVGIGRDADQAYRAWRTTVNGNRVAVIGATQVIDDNLVSAWTASGHHAGLASAKNVARMVRAVRAARKGSDVVIVYLHWGQEYHPCPLPRQRALAQRLAKAGADIIVGGHAHTPLGAGYMGGAYVDYGFGNFVFSLKHGLDHGAQSHRSGVLTLRVSGRRVTRAVWSPAVIRDGLPRPLAGASAARAVRRWRALRGCAHLAARP
ncbi:MAG TPA: CapA family protein [Streptosporangiaceae bacterium]|jgi:poly-gamma-glutamate synthesis protein (capsule biosynthesis protein)